MIGAWGRPRGMRVAPRNLGQIRAAALRARQILDIDEHPIDMGDLLENRLRRNGIHFHIVEPEAIPGDAARAIPDKGLLLITNEAYIALKNEHPGHTLLIPHEIGHFALDHSMFFARSRSSLPEPHSMFEDSEIQADQFSHEFVMPIMLVRRHCSSVEDIQRTFGVPIQDARLRHLVLRTEGHLD